MFLMKFAIEELGAQSFIFCYDDVLLSPDTFEMTKFLWENIISNPKYKQMVAGVKINNSREGIFMEGYKWEDFFEFKWIKRFSSWGFMIPNFLWQDFLDSFTWTDWPFLYRHYFRNNLKKQWITPLIGRSKHIGFVLESGIHYGSQHELTKFQEQHSRYSLPLKEIHYKDSKDTWVNFNLSFHKRKRPETIKKKLKTYE